jgi:hypothetical protein
VRIGFIFECGPAGADQQVCEYLARKLLPGVECISRTLDKKVHLLNDAGRVAAALLADGCDRVLIVWDLRPAWPDKKHKPCRRIERVALLEILDKVGIADQSIFLVCIEQELESWLLADERKLAKHLSTSAHQYTVPKVRHPDREQQPKATVINHFKAARGWRYNDKVDAVRVVSRGEPAWDRLRRSQSFARFERKIKGKLMSCQRNYCL